MGAAPRFIHWEASDVDASRGSPTSTRPSRISGKAPLLSSVRRCFASLFKDRAISYRVDNVFEHFKVHQSA